MTIVLSARCTFIFMTSNGILFCFQVHRSEGCILSIGFTYLGSDIWAVALFAYERNIRRRSCLPQPIWTDALPSSKAWSVNSTYSTIWETLLVLVSGETHLGEIESFAHFTLCRSNPYWLSAKRWNIVDCWMGVPVYTSYRGMMISPLRIQPALHEVCMEGAGTTMFTITQCALLSINSEFAVP